MTLFCATTNPGKLREFRLAAETFAPGRFEIVSLPDIKNIDPPDETGATFEENAALKAVYYSTHAEGLLFADDSGLEVDALGAEPGVHSARYAGDDATDLANNELLVSKLEGVADRTARFVCVIALADRGKLVRTFRGAVEGRIVDHPSGPNGFGYDPHFFYEPFGCTFGDATNEMKLGVSHRGAALDQMLGWLLGDARPQQ